MALFRSSHSQFLSSSPPHVTCTQYNRFYPPLPVLLSFSHSPSYSFDIVRNLSLFYTSSTTVPQAVPSPSPIFLPHLETDEEDAEEEAAELEDEDYGSAEDQDEDDIDYEDTYEDPIRDFLRSRSPAADPVVEGRVAFQKNRRSSWHLAADFSSKNLSNSYEEDDDPEAESVSGSGGDDQVSNLAEEDGVLGEVMRLARNPPQNMTLGELLEPYAGRLGQGECIELLKRMGKENLLPSCLYLFEWMGLQSPPLLTPRAYSVMFPLLGKARLGDKLVLLFENLPKAKRFRDVHVYNAAISGLLCCDRYDDAWRIYEEMETNNVMPDHVTCSSLITVIRKSGRSAKEAWELFEKMNRKGVKWGLEACGALVKSFCAEGMKKEALIFQTQMENRGITSSTIIYNTLMDAYVKSNQVEEAEGLFNELKEKGLQPTTATYNILMDAYCKRLQPEVVEDLLVEMQKTGLKPNVKSYTILISAYGRQRKMSDMAADAFLRMKKAGIKPTSHSYTALIHAYSMCGWHDKALAAFENMEREGISPCLETYTALLDAFRRAGDAEMVMKIWKAMLHDKVEGTRVTFNIVLDCLAKQGMYVQARDVIHEFTQLNILPDVMSYNILMNAYARGGQHNKMPELLKEMAARNLKPDPITYLTMIYAYVRVRDFRRAFYYHKEMVRSGQVPEERSYRKLRAILDVKAGIKNRRDKSAILGIVNSTMGMSKPKGKKDEFWKNRKKQQSRMSKLRPSANR